HTFLGFMHWIKDAPQGSPGLLGKGGAIAGGLPFTRVDLHWMYNTLYTIPFVLALIYQLRRTYDEALEMAFPDAPKSELVETGKHLETIRFARGQTILAPGEDVERLYIISEGEAEVYTHDEKGNVVEVARLHRGQYIGDIGLLVRNVAHTKTVRAVTDVSTLAMDESTFRHLMAASQLTRDEMLALAGAHLAPAAKTPKSAARRASRPAAKTSAAAKKTAPAKKAATVRKPTVPEARKPATKKTAAKTGASKS
ncbi:MAG: putative transport system ATP-binding protein, partial [Frankiaceae bacterium]|nr:putative transport system ATP-binding protein [Frankiaceae bacterium]